MTVLEIIQKSAEFLGKRGVDSPRLQAELMLAAVLKLPRMKLYLNFERLVTETEADAMREMVKRRATREPLQHIVGTTSFCGLEMAVNRHVLVPRPETELLAELGWEFLKGKAGEMSTTSPRPSPPFHGRGGGEVAGVTALDFGTGSGCIAIALAAKCPTAKVVALDVSTEALAVARQNAEKNGVAGRMEFVQGDGFAALKAGRRFDLFISNPPYIASAEIETLQPEVKDFDPRGALDGGADGLDFYRELAKKAGEFLNPQGKIMLEFGDGQADEIRKIFETQKWIVEAIRDDYSQRQRILIARPGEK